MPARRCGASLPPGGRGGTAETAARAAQPGPRNLNICSRLGPGARPAGSGPTMLTTYTVENGGLSVRDGAQEAEALRRAVWIDLLSPSVEEEKQVQAALRLEVPTREEMQEIESSSRLY